MGHEGQQENEVPRRPKVLAVDDEPAVLEWLLAALDALGYDAVGVASASEAEARAEAEMPDVVVSDALLRGDSGSALARRLRVRRPGLPVILTSGYRRADLPGEEAPPAGVLFLAKPFSLDELEGALREALAGARR